MLTTRSELGSGKIAEFNRDICKNLSFVWSEGGGLGQKNKNQNNKPLWAGYKSFRWEADPSDAITDSRPYLRWAFPRVLGDGQMEFLQPAETDAVWSKNVWGIWEPDPRTSESIKIKECVGVLIPGVAFDRQGHRLGYGKGFYDKALSDFQGLKVGVAFGLQVVDQQLPNDATDVTMDMIVTDKEIIRISRRH
jgi:5-formyltetrahydrofolate cyclo-ligase